MNILLHIGQSKTGTSAIQAFLTLNRMELQKAGILYPVANVAGLPLDFGNHNWVADAVAGESHYPHLTAEQYFDQFFSEAKQLNSRLMVLSAEHFFGGQPRIWQVKDDQDYVAGYRNKLKNLAKFMAGHQVTVLVYLRPQIDWLASAISQTVRIERLIGGKAIYRDDWQFFELSKPVLRYGRLLDFWNEYLQPWKMIVVPYVRDNLRDKSSIADFVHRAGLAGLDLPMASKTIQVNQSLSHEFVEVKKILNRSPKKKTSERVIIDCLQRLSARNGKGRPYSISPELMETVIRFVQPDLDHINQRYIGNGEPLKAVSDMVGTRSLTAPSQEDVDAALAAFKREYRKPRTKLRWLDQATRAFLREHAKPIHGALHNLKTAYRRRSLGNHA
jgi:hypothetical protein